MPIRIRNSSEQQRQQETLSSVEWTPRIKAAVLRILESFGESPIDFAIVLGSGLAAFTERLADQQELPFENVPHFPRTSVLGHPGSLVVGRLGENRILAMAGRLHGYEGHTAAAVAFPIRVLCRLGISGLVLTNASGCLNADWSPGDLMRITDHLNLSGRNPLVGPHDPELGLRFPDLSSAYDRRLATALEDGARASGVTLRAGIYAHVLGPSYETPAEVRMLRLLGADAVGMSTVPEVIAAAQMQVPVAAVACLTNLAAGLLDRPLTHAEVTAAAERMSHRFIALLEAFFVRARGALAPTA